jgi:hypothetical protein
LKQGREERFDASSLCSVGCSQRSSRLDGLNALFDDVGIAYVVLMQERCEGRFARALDGIERRPARQEVAENDRIYVVKPV